MKFIYARRIKECKFCGATINRGEPVVLTSHRNRVTGRYYSFPYHYECYIQYFTDKVRRDAMAFLGTLELPKKIGRPRKYKNPKEANKLMALIAYHEKAGNVERVNEVRRELDHAIL